MLYTYPQFEDGVPRTFLDFRMTNLDTKKYVRPFIGRMALLISISNRRFAERNATSDVK